ncbi:hypothetical protein AB0M80_05280 [Amycolatopsis sp. NPDC051045]|uniref:VMAP-C domain-containing protein n=1 Tax=Amycolatopsis sp. NPDC051045 TaxID=3156922 RepID=UPI003449BFFD
MRHAEELLRPVPAHVIREAVVDVLAEAGLADDVTGRSLMIRLISQTLDVELAIPQHATGRSQLIEVVSACSRYEGGMLALAYVVGFMRPGSPECERIHQLVQRPRVLDLLPPAEQDRLREWLAGVVFPGLSALMRRAGGPGMPRPPEVPNAWEAFFYLADFNAGSDGVPPAFAFLELVAHRIGGRLSGRLTEWNDFQARRLRIESALLARRAAAAQEQPENARLHLMIVVEHDAIDAGRYLVSHWCQEDPGEWPPPCGGSELVFAADLERHVDRLVVGAERLWSEHRGTVALEFVLPRALLNLPVHRWHREYDSGAPRPLSVDYVIVVRSLERMNSRHWHRLWHMHWDALMADPAGARVFFENGDDSSDLDLVLSEPEWALVVLDAAPSPEPRTGADSLTAALRSGVPAVLWHPRVASETLRELVAEFTAGEGIGDLAMRVKDARRPTRQDSGPSFENVMRDLVVLWDDPSRLVHFDRQAGHSRRREEIVDEREQAS